MKPLLCLLLSLVLVGCSSYKEQFDCPVGTGMGCASLSRVSKAMDQGRISIEDVDLETQESPQVIWGQSFTAVG